MKCMIACVCPGQSSIRLLGKPRTSRMISRQAAASEALSLSSNEYRSLFIKKRKLPEFVQLDHHQRRRDKEVAEIAEAARRHGMTKQQVVERVATLEKLMPELAPNMDKMKASDWVSLLKDVDMVGIKIVVLKSFYPTANLGKIIAKTPKYLLQSVQSLKEDAIQVRAILGDKVPNLDAIIEAIPDLMKPQQTLLTLSNLRRWFPRQDEYELLQKNPGLLYQISEADLDPDPTYGGEVGVMD